VAVKRAQFLEKKIIENNYNIGVEVGVQAGKTFKHLIKNLNELTLYGVDGWFLDKNTRLTEQPLEGTEPSSNYYSLKKWIEEHNVSHRAFLVRSYTHTCLDKFEDESLDFVFIDADHTYEGVKKDTLNWAKKVKLGGLVSGHDSNYPSIQKFIQEIPTNLQIQRDIGFSDMNYAIDNVWWYYKRQW